MREGKDITLSDIVTASDPAEALKELKVEQENNMSEDKTISDIVCLFKLAKILKELGVEQDSVFFWYTDGLNKEVQQKTDYISGVYGYGGKEDYFCSAFTASELGIMLPAYIPGHGHLSTVKSLPDTDMTSWKVIYFDILSERIKITDFREADARAAMLIHLIREGKVEL